MTKIEEFKKEKQDHEIMVSNAYTAMNEGAYKRQSRDKYGLRIGGKWHDHGEHMGYLTGHSGHYGDSGCTYRCDPRIAQYLKTVINARMKELVDAAIVLSEKDVEKKRLAAESEAKLVLEQTS